MSFWESSAFWGIAGIVVGILVATFFFVHGKSKKILKYEIRTTALITKSMSEIPLIHITFAGQPVQSMLSSTVKFSNIGNQSISSEDFAKLAPLRISTENRFFSLTNGFQITSDDPIDIHVLHGTNKNSIDVAFDFLPPKHSFSITFLHEGALSASGVLKSGKMIDAASIEHLMGKKEFLIYCIMILSASFFFSFYVFWDLYESHPLIESIFISTLCLILIAFSLAICILLYSFLWNLCSKLVHILKSKFKSSRGNYQ